MQENNNHYHVTDLRVALHGYGRLVRRDKVKEDGADNLMMMHIVIIIITWTQQIKTFPVIEIILIEIKTKNIFYDFQLKNQIEPTSFPDQSS